jgi:anti-sigma factor RsiW
MNCELLEKVALYADDEMDGAAREKMTAHLHSCADCTAALAAHLDLKKAVRIAGKHFSAPPDLHAAVFKQVRAPQGVSPWWKWAMAPVAAVLLAAVIFALRPVSQPNSVVAGLVDQHVTMTAANHLDVISEDRHTVKPWFTGKLPFTFNPPALASDSPYKLLGANLVYAQQKPGAELVYQAGRHKVSIFVFSALDQETREPAWKQELSYTISTWSSGGRQCYLVTDANKDEARQLAIMFQEANRS